MTLDQKGKSRKEVRERSEAEIEVSVLMRNATRYDESKRKGYLQ